MNAANNRRRRRAPRRVVDFHALSAQRYDVLATRLAFDSQTATPEQRHQLAHRCARLRARAAWHRVRIGRPVSDAVARAAAIARHALECAKNAATANDRRQWLRRYALAMTRAGDALSNELAAKRVGQTDIVSASQKATPARGGRDGESTEKIHMACNEKHNI